MSLSPERCLRGVLDTLNTRITPALTDGYAAEVARLAGLVLTITTNSIDDAAAIRIAENDAMRDLFGGAAGIVGDADIAERLAVAGAAHGSGLKLSQLDADNAQLRALLVELHEAAEGQDGDAARALESRIWQMLKAFEAARTAPLTALSD